jgi:hypothetical protein
LTLVAQDILTCKKNIEKLFEGDIKIKEVLGKISSD